MLRLRPGSECVRRRAKRRSMRACVIALRFRAADVEAAQFFQRQILDPRCRGRQPLARAVASTPASSGGRDTLRPRRQLRWMSSSAPSQPRSMASVNAASVFSGRSPAPPRWANVPASSSPGCSARQSAAAIIRERIGEIEHAAQHPFAGAVRRIDGKQHDFHMQFVDGAGHQERESTITGLSLSIAEKLFFGWSRNSLTENNSDNCGL